MDAGGLARELIAFDEAEDLARDVLGRVTDPGLVDDAGYYLSTALHGLRTRHALAEVAIAAIGGDESGNIVDLTARIAPLAPGRRARFAPDLIEGYTSAFLFAAWSTIETSAFALNAIGFALAPNRFFSLRDAKKGLGRVSPRSIRVHEGARDLFPRFGAALDHHADPLELLEDLHVVSKHRHATVGGAQLAMRARSAFDPMLLRVSGATEVFVLADPWETRADRGSRSLASDPSRPLGPLVVDWRYALTNLGEALRDDLSKHV